MNPTSNVGREYHVQEEEKPTPKYVLREVVTHLGECGKMKKLILVTVLIGFFAISSYSQERDYYKEKFEFEERLQKEQFLQWYKERQEQERIQQNWKKILLGITKERVISLVGKPDQINRTIGEWGVHEQWVYGRTYLYFENGILTAWQD